MDDIILNISILDHQSANFKESKNRLQIHKIIKEAINKILERQKDFAKKLEDNPFCVGIWVTSEFYPEQFFKSGALESKKSKLEFFNPATFSRSIPGAIASNIIDNFNIRGYSATFIKSDLVYNLIEFHATSLDYGFLLNIDHNSKNETKLNILLLSKKQTSNSLINFKVTKYFDSNIKNIDILYCNDNKNKLFLNNNQFKIIDFKHLTIFDIIEEIISKTFNKKVAIYYNINDQTILFSR